MKTKEKTKKKAELAIKDLRENHNHSLYEEIYQRNQDNLDGIAIIYRGNKITYREMFEKIDEYANSLAALGYKKGSEVLTCMSPTPEFYYLFLATMKIGAVMNPIGEWFDKDYLHEIMNSCKNKNIFVTDDNFLDIKLTIEENKNIENIVMFSLNDSLPQKNGVKFDPSDEIDKKFKSFDNHFGEYSSITKKSMTSPVQFLSEGDNYAREFGNVKPAKVDLNDPCTITYTSGTTNPGRPKGVLHPIKSYMTISRFKDSDVSGMPPMRNMSVLAHFPTYVHAGLTTSITDPFFQKCTIIAEPIYDIEYFPYAIILNKPSYACGSNAAWTNFGKKLEFDESFKDITCPYLFMATVTGEGTTIGEDKFYNYVAKKHKFGTDKFPFNIVPVTFSNGGGTGEASGILVTLFKGTQELKPYYKVFGYNYGLTPLSCTEVEVFNKEGLPCRVGEVGSICTRGECEMDGYYYQPELNKTMEFYDAEGNRWLKMGAYGVKNDNSGNIQIKGRMRDHVLLGSGEEFPLFVIEDAVNMDSKHILACTAVKIEHKDRLDDIVVHFEPQPHSNITTDALIKEVIERLEYFVPEELKDNIYLRYRNNLESFPAAPSGKRDIAGLINEGTLNTINYRDAINFYIKPKTFTLEQKSA